MIAILRKQQDSPRHQTAATIAGAFGSWPETGIEEMRPEATFDGTSLPHADLSLADLQVGAVRAQPAEFPRDPTTISASAHSLSAPRREASGLPVTCV